MSVSLSSDDLEAIRQLLKLVTDNQLSELTVSVREGLSITIKSDEFAPEAQLVTAYSHAALREARRPAAPKLEPAAAPSIPERGVPILSPMMGIFYVSPAPGEPPFVQVGDQITIGQPIGLIEAMKVFSEVPSELEGRVVAIAAKNGEIIQLGQPIMFVESA